MQVTEILSDGLRRGFAVVVPAADVETKRSKRLAELSRTLNLPGFRPGKVPANLVRKRFGGAVTAEVLEESVNDATRQVLDDRGLRSATQPKVEVTSLDPASDLEFKVEVELLPEIALPDFSGIALTRLKAEPSAETVEKALAEIAERQRTLQDVEARPAQAGDVLMVDFSGRIDGKSFAGGTGTDLPVELGATGFIPGFAEQVEGMSPGEQRTIEATFPADYASAEVAGKTATFDVTAKALKRKEVPAVDDALATKLGFDSLDEVSTLISSQVRREYENLSRLRIKRQLLDALAEHADFPVPPSMVEGEFAQIWQRVQQERDSGKLEAEDAAKDEETLKQEYRAIAERRVRLGLLLAEVGRVQGIQVTPEEMNRAMRVEANRYPGQQQQVLDLFRKHPEAAEALRGPIYEDKVVDYILGVAQVSEQIVSPEELARDPEVEAAAPDATAAARQAATADASASDAGAPEAAAPEAAVSDAVAEPEAPGQMPGAEG
jgi:trigger factor